jgi:hypothetical protein
MTLRVIPLGLAAASAEIEALTARLTAAHAALAAQVVEEQDRSGVGVAESGTSYAAGDGSAASSYLVAGG